MTELTPQAAVGKAGERHARLWLEARGYRFVAANWHCKAGEIDLVMLDGAELVFVEVKTRTGQRAGHASDAVDISKNQHVLDTSEWFVSEHQEYENILWRCDVIAITLGASSSVRSVEHSIAAIYDE